MSTAGLLGTFFVVWWLVFLMTLPFGVRQETDPVPGNDPGAPAKPHLMAKILVTTVLAALATWGLAWLLNSGMVEFHVPAA